MFVKRLTLILLVMLIVLPKSQALANQVLSSATKLFDYKDQHSNAKALLAQSDGEKFIVVSFENSDNLHFYADGDMALSVSAKANGATISDAIYPASSSFTDPTSGNNVPVYMGSFDVVFPVKPKDKTTGSVDVDIEISAFACTNEVCLRPVTREISIKANFKDQAAWAPMEINNTHADDGVIGDVDTEKSKSSVITLGYLLLAVAAGFSFNLMPCVLPIIPLIIGKLLKNSQQSRSRSISLGVSFCVGIVSFFMVFGVLSILFKLVTGSVFSWSDQFRYPSFVIGMSLSIVVFALFMFDVFTLSIPHSIAGKGGQGSGILASVVMGFFAALLSTPCTGAIIGFVLVWAQTQSYSIVLLVFALMGLGMALPYAFLAAFPKLLSKVPKPGTWMEHLRNAMGFILLLIAVKLFASLPKERLVNVLFFAVVLSFSLWMWGSWVTLSTATIKKWIIRFCAVLLAVSAGFLLLTQSKEMVDWQDYDAVKIANAQKSHKEILIKFTADWCTNCVVLDKKVFHDSEIAKLLKSKDILKIKADTTTIDMPATKDLKDVYGEAGNVPVTIFIDAQGKEHKLRGIFSKQELIDLLEGK